MNARPHTLRPAAAARFARQPLAVLAAVLVGLACLWFASPAVHAEPEEPGLVRSANLIYANNKTSVCFSDEFLAQAQKDSLIRTHQKFVAVKMEADDLFEHPFAVMTGEGNFTLTQPQRENLTTYLKSGGFLVASAGCSSRPWNRAFEREITRMFPDRELITLDAKHPVFHTVYDIRSSRYRSGQSKLPDLRALEIDGRVVMIWSHDGLNDTANAAPECCCCGGNELQSARRINVNLLAYALTH